MKLSPTQQAEQIIKKELDERTGVLNLHGLGLTDLPEATSDMTWLRVLNFSHEERWDEEKQDWVKVKDRTKHNRISSLPSWIGSLKNLTHINLDGSCVDNLKNLKAIKKLRSLLCDSEKLNDLRPISSLKELQILSFNNSGVCDLTPLSNLKNLKELFFYGTDVRDLGPLTKLSALQRLSFYKTNVKDLSPLESLSNLLYLDCSQTQVIDLKPISGLFQLQSLECSITEISDINPINQLSGLQKLSCAETKLNNLSSVSSLHNLVFLNCHSTQIKDLSPISGLSKLQELHFSSTEISNLEPIQKLTRLLKLGCSKTKICDLSPISNFSELQELYCHSTEVSNLNAIKKLSKLQILNFSETKISDLSPLSDLCELVILSCYKTQVQDLTPISDLTELQELYCSSSEVSDISPIKKLSKLQILNFAETKVCDLSPVEDLSKLEELYFTRTEISDLSPITKMSALKILNFSDTEISDLSPIARLFKLQKLFFSSTGISNLNPIKELSNLKILIFSNTKIDDLKPTAGLSELQQLHCYGTKVNNLVPVSKLLNLTHLDIEDTSVHNLTPLINLPKLQHLDCAGTLVEDLSPIQGVLERGSIRWENSPLFSPPIEFAEQGSDAIREYYEQLEQNPVPLNELKVIFLGEGASGKTSLIKCLRNESFDPKEEQTHGIRIQKTNFKIDNDNIKAHFWDFGGQEVMHATHQFFLSQRCIYILVLNSRTDDRAEHWLKHAKFFGGHSPVLVVLNKIDENPSFEVDRKALSTKYPQIEGYFPLSCKSRAGLDLFQDALLEQMTKSPTRKTPFPAAWSAVKQYFEGIEQDYTDSSHFTAVCQEHGVSKPFSQKVLLKFLHDLGVIIHFEDLLKYCDVQILNPIWLTTGVYRIINSQTVTDNKGILSGCQFNEVINDPRYKLGNTNTKEYVYPINTLSHIVRIMQEFELCYPLNADSYVIPQLLPVAEPEFSFEGASIHFEVKFPSFFPDSIFPRLMVKLHRYIDNNLHWRSGMVLNSSLFLGAKARIRSDKEDRKLSIDVCGEKPRNLLSFIRATIKEIVSDFKGLRCLEKVTIPSDDTEELIQRDYSEIVAYENAKETEVFIAELGRRVLVKDILDGVEDVEMRDEISKLELQAFVSYSHKDLEGLENLKAALAPARRLGNLKLWHDQAIDAGEDWEDKIFEQLERSDIVLCLVSQDFLNSDFCDRELTKALSRHREGKQTVVPICYRKCDWDDLPIASIQSPQSKWIKSSTDEDDAWTGVSKGLKSVIAEAKKRKLDKKKEMQRKSSS